MGLRNRLMSITTLPAAGLRLAAIALLATSVHASAAASENSLESNPLLTVDPVTLAARERFIKARSALAEADVEAFEQYKATLSDYPLYGYLEYEGLSHEFRNEKPTKQSVGKLNAFETKFKDKALTRKLTRTLQSRLAETEQWTLFLAVSQSTLAASLKCSHLRANYELGNISGFTDEVIEFWIQPKQHHERCQPVLDAIEAEHTPPVKAIWERIFLAFEEDKPKYAKDMLGYLASYERKQVNNWLDALEEPEAFLNHPALKDDTQINRRRFVDLILAWSKTDTVAAMEHWQANNERFTFYADRHYDTHRLLAFRAAYRRLPEAYEFLMSVPGRDEDLELKEWRIRAALFDQNWLNVIKNIRRLPKEEQQEDHWAYWEARALEIAGHTDKANEIYQTLAELQSYHGFLSADRLNQNYSIRNEPIPYVAAEVEALAARPDAIRAREYHHTGVTWESRREWNSILSDAPDNQVAAAVQLAGHWNMVDRAIATAGRAKEFRRAIEVRFPVVFEDLVKTHTTENELDPSLVLGLMRRESGFMADAKSPVGASGLMQLMPATAADVARRMGEKNWRGDLNDPETNIEMGTFYFRYVLDQFDDREILAAAGYNAGPHRVRSWLPDAAMPGDVWVDAIPFSETRRYVRALLAYAAIYDVLLTGKQKRISDRLADVPAAEKEDA